MGQFEYPRPQLVRDQWQSLDGEWEFEFDDQHRYCLPSDDIPWSRRINVPFAPESELSGIGDTGFHTACWYRCHFKVQQRAARTLPHFGAVDYQARVWSNDHLVAEHEGGHTSFAAGISAPDWRNPLWRHADGSVAEW